MKLQDEHLLEARRQLSSAPWGSRGELVSSYSRAWGVSEQTVWQKVGIERGRKRREDAGRSVVSQADATLLASHMLLTQRKTGKILSDIEAGKRDLFENGRISREAFMASNSTWARELRKRGLGKDHLKSPSLATELDSRHPNEWHLVDASVGILFYLSKSGKMRFRRLDLMDPKNKPDTFATEVQKRQLLIRWVLVDHYSGAFVVDYREASGELTSDLIDFLHYCWTPKDDKRWPFYGVPNHLYADQGPATKASHIRSLEKALGFTLHLHQSSHERADAPAARATGGVEVVHRVWEHTFESQWRFNPPTGGLAQIREQARDACIALNSDPQHVTRGTKFTRSQLWMDITEGQLRIPPRLEVFRELAVSQAEQRTLDNYGRIHLDGQLFKIDHCPWYPGEVVEVRRNAFDAQRIQVTCMRTGETLEAVQLQKRRNGRSSAAAYLGEKVTAVPGQPGAHQPLHTAAQLRKEVAEDMREKRGLAAPGAIVTSLGRASESLVVEFVPRVGTPIIPAISGRRVDAIDVCFMAVDRLGRGLETAEREWLEAQIGEGWMDELEAVQKVEELAARSGLQKQVLTFARRTT